MANEFDFIVVGGGSAGAVIASRLSEDPACRVALIEAGERPPEISALPIAPPAMQLNPATDWMYTADPGKAGLGLNGRRVPVPRGKMLGGSSGINYMMYVRGHPGDFDSWAAGGASGWSYAEVLPYFRKSEGLTPNDEIIAGEPEQRPNLTIITGAQATRVLLDAADSQTVATGVEYRTTAGETMTARVAKEVILSAGAIGSPQLLLLSGIGPRQELEAAGVSC